MMMCIKISAIAEMICFELYHTIQWLYFFSLKKLFLVLLMELVSEVLFLSTLLKRRHSRCRSSKKIVGESMKIVCESFFCFEPWLQNTFFRTYHVSKSFEGEKSFFLCVWLIFPLW
jgi:hypothetical protein